MPLRRTPLSPILCFQAEGTRGYSQCIEAAGDDNPIPTTGIACPSSVTLCKMESGSFCSGYIIPVMSPEIGDPFRYGLYPFEVISTVCN